MTDDTARAEGSGTTTECPLDGVHEHPFRGPHTFTEWYPSPDRPTGLLREFFAGYLEHHPDAQGSEGCEYPIPKGSKDGRNE